MLLFAVRPPKPSTCERQGMPTTETMQCEKQTAIPKRRPRTCDPEPRKSQGTQNMNKQRHTSWPGDSDTKQQNTQKPQLRIRGSAVPKPKTSTNKEDPPNGLAAGARSMGMKLCLLVLLVFWFGAARPSGGEFVIVLVVAWFVV